MRREDAIKIATGLRTDFKCESDTMIDFCSTIIKALENQCPSKCADCEDCLANEPCEDWHDVPSDEMTLGQARQAVKDLRKFVMDNHILPKLQPCEDVISRKAVLERAINVPIARVVTEDKVICRKVVFVDDIENIPPVTPTRKKGHWIMKHRTHNVMKHYTGQDEMGETHTISVYERYEADEPYCSECGKLAGDTSQNYCCACGAEMQGVEE